MYTQQKQTELLKEQSSVENYHTDNNNSSELTYEKQYHETGIYIRGNENGYFITAGQYIISRGHNTPEDAYNAISNRHYEVIMGLISAMIQFNKDLSEQ